MFPMFCCSRSAAVRGWNHEAGVTDLCIRRIINAPIDDYYRTDDKFLRITVNENSKVVNVSTR
jgi:hypothetical protein